MSEDRTRKRPAEDSSSGLHRDGCSDENKKKMKKHKHDRSSVTKKKHKKEKRKKSSSRETKKDKKSYKRLKTSYTEDIVGPTMAVPAAATIQRSQGPMTKEQYEKKQSTTRRVFDEDTGRYRLIRGDGEVVEEIVSKQRQQQINKLATAGDGMSFQSGLTQFYK